MNKKQLREQMKAYRLEMDKDKRREYDKKIADTLLDIIKPFDEILCYVSSDIEVDTRRFLTELFKDDTKRVLAPRCVKGTNIMHFHPISGFDDLESGSYSIDEPKESIAAITEFSDKSCCIVPALCYDKKGYRVGFGKGFYDRFLAGFNGKRIGICYSGCIVDSIDSDKTDICADIVITEKSVSYINEREISFNG